MPEYPVITENDGVTVAIPFAVSTEAGDVFGPHEYWATNDFPMAHLDTETIDGSYLRIEANAGSGWKSSGLAILDEKWTRITIFGIDNTGDPTMSPQITGSTSIGSGAVVFLDPIPKGTARKFNLEIDPPASASPGIIQIRIFLVTKQNVIVLAGQISVAIGSGVVPGYRNPQFRRVASGQQLLAAGTDTITVERGAIDYDGKREVFVRETFVLDQNAAVGALAAGESYYAVATRKKDRTLTITKGIRAAGPVLPVFPADEVYLGEVLVHYDAVSSIIVQGDVSTTKVARGDYEIVAGAGLSIVVRPGEGIAGDRYQFNSSSVIMAVPDATTSRIWRESNDSFTVTATDDAPSPYADLMARVTTVAGAVTTIEDTRKFLSLPVVVVTGNVQSSLVLSTAVVPVRLGTIVLADDLDLDEVILDLDELDGTWTAGSVQIDVKTYAPGVSTVGAGMTVFTSSETDDQRPSIAYDAVSLRSSSRFAEIRHLAKGTRIVVSLVAVPAAPGAEPARTVFAQLNFRRAR